MDDFLSLDWIATLGQEHGKFEGPKQSQFYSVTVNNAEGGPVERHWDIDKALELTKATSPRNLEVRYWYVNYVETRRTVVDPEYVNAITEEQLRKAKPVIAIKIPGDLGFKPTRVGSLCVIDGNHRLARAYGLGWTYFPVVELTEEQERACRITSEEKHARDVAYTKAVEAQMMKTQRPKDPPPADAEPKNP